MLRRVSRAFLVVLGLSAVALMLITSFAYLSVSSEWPRDQVILELRGGTLRLTWYQDISALQVSLERPIVDAGLHSPHMPYMGLPDLYRHSSDGIPLYAIVNIDDEPGFAGYTIFIPL
jgi:hypothetical protein